MLETIKTIPRSVEDAYDKILSKSRDSKHTLKLLQLVVAAARPLHVREIAVALAINEAQNRRTYADIMADVANETQLQQQIRDLCGLFVIIVGGRLYLLHQTAKEFLVSTCSQVATGLEWRHSINLDTANASLARVCLMFLLLLPKPASQEEHISGSLTKACQDFVFLEYAATYWPEHFRQVENAANTKLVSLALDFCMAELWPGNCLWLLIHQLSWVQHKRISVESGLEIVAYLGLTSLLRPCLRRLQYLSSSYWCSMDRGDALVMASEQGHVDFVKDLLELGPGGKPSVLRHLGFRSPPTFPLVSRIAALTSAVGNGRNRVVEMLLRAGVEVDDGYDLGDDTPLSVAMRCGNESIIALLREYGMRPDADCFNAMTKAAFYGDCDQIQKLLDTEHPVNAVDAGGSTALLRATKRGHLSAARLLLEHGADIDADDSTEMTALLYAVDTGDHNMVSFLLDFNANIDPPLSCVNALELAAQSDRVDMLELLLSHKPKPKRLERCRAGTFWSARSVEFIKLLL